MARGERRTQAQAAHTRRRVMLPGERNPAARLRIPLHPSEVRFFLEGSALPAPLYHCTDAASYQGLLARGIDPSACRDGLFGTGLYAATAPAIGYGSTTVRVAVAARNPCQIDVAEFDRRLERAGGRPDRVLREIIDAGHDVLVLTGQNDDPSYREALILADACNARVIDDGPDGYQGPSPTADTSWVV